MNRLRHLIERDRYERLKEQRGSQKSQKIMETGRGPPQRHAQYRACRQGEQIHECGAGEVELPLRDGIGKNTNRAESEPEHGQKAGVRRPDFAGLACDKIYEKDRQK